MFTRKTPLEVRFWRHVDVREPDECWPWIGYSIKESNGQRRGWIMITNKPKLYTTAPRALLIIQGLNPGRWDFACHHCDNPICVNPAHIYMGSPTTNQADARARNRITKSGRDPYKLTDEQVRYIREECARNIPGRQTQLAREFGVSDSLISLIKHGKNRSHA